MDEFDAFDFSEFTEDDFKEIDASVAKIQLSPLAVHRPARILSVSDLAGPAWCELQFDYGLRQHRQRPLHRRPTSFLSAAGNRIHVALPVAAQNDKTTKRGKAVHKQLERELNPEPVPVTVASREDHWGLRFLNLIISCHSLLFDGITREIPVFGIVQDHVIVGVIDEIIRSSNILRISDTKSRSSNSLPSHDDTLPSRIQLMLYHSLLSALLSTDIPFPFSTLWSYLSLDPSAPFSSDLYVHTAQLPAPHPPACLDDLATFWSSFLTHADTLSLDSTLHIVYRLRPRNSYPIDLDLEDISPPPDTRSIIGTKEFIYDHDFLHKYLRAVFEWWHGRRKPQGVALQHVQRCFSCEYQQGCEWREEKALEFRRKNVRPL